MKKISLLLFSTLLILASCSKDQPSSPAEKITSTPQAVDFYKSFHLNWSPGTYKTGGRAQYATTAPQNLSGGGQGKVNFFLFDDDQTYALEYWELGGNNLQGAVSTGRWFVNDQRELVLVEADNRRIAVGKPMTMQDGKGGISLKLDNFNVTDRNNKLNGTGKSIEWIVFYSPGPTSRTLPANLKENLPAKVAEVGAQKDQKAFLE